MTRLMTAMMMTDASVAWGRWYSSGVSAISVMPTTTPVITAEKPVTAPELIFTADRENEPDTAYPPEKLETMLPRPWPTSSWLAYREAAWEKVKIVVQMEIVWTLLGTLVALWGLIFAGFPKVDWLNALVLGGFAAAFTYFYFRGQIG